MLVNGILGDINLSSLKEPKKYFNQLVSYVITELQDFPEDFIADGNLLFNLTDSEVFKDETKEKTKEIIELMYKGLLNSLEKKNYQSMVEYRGALSHFCAFGDKDILLKFILPLQSNFFKDDLNLKCASVFMFVSIVPLEIESVYKFIQKTYPIFLKTAMDKKQSVAFRLSCIYAIHFINGHYPKILFDHKKEVIKMIQQLLDEDLSYDEEFIFNLLCIIFDMNDSEHLLSQSETIQFLGPLFERSLDSKPLMIFSFPNNITLFQELEKIILELVENVDDVSFFKPILDKALKLYPKEIDKDKESIVSHFLSIYIKDSKNPQSEFDEYEHLFKEIFKSDNFSVVVGLPELIPYSKDKLSWKTYFKKLMKHVKEGNIKAFEVFQIYTLENTPFLRYILNNIDVFLQIFQKLFENNHYKLKGNILELYSQLLRYYQKDDFVKKCYNYSLTMVEELLEKNEDDDDDYESKCNGAIELVNELFLTFGDGYQRLSFENFLRPSFKLFMKTRESPILHQSYLGNRLLFYLNSFNAIGFDKITEMEEKDVFQIIEEDLKEGLESDEEDIVLIARDCIGMNMNLKFKKKK